MGIPKQIKQAIATHETEAWTVLHTIDDMGHYTDVYKANGHPIFQLSWWDKMSKPTWRVYDEEAAAIK